MPPSRNKEFVLETTETQPERSGFHITDLLLFFPAFFGLFMLGVICFPLVYVVLLTFHVKAGFLGYGMMVLSPHVLLCLFAFIEMRKLQLTTNARIIWSLIMLFMIIIGPIAMIIKTRAEW